MATTQINRTDLYRDDLKNMQFLGVVVDSNDPEHDARCRIRVFGKFDDLGDSDLPWAKPLFGLSFGVDGSGAVSVPKEGGVVCVRFNNGNLYTPEYFAIQEIAPDLKQEISGSYKNAHSVIYDKDEDLQVFYTQQKGVSIILKGSRINIAKDKAITIEHDGTTAIIELRGNNITVTCDSELNSTAGSRIKETSPEIWIDGKETKLGHVPAYSAVLAEPLFAYLKTLSAAVDAKLFPTPSAMASACAIAEQLATSKTVKVSS